MVKHIEQIKTIVIVSLIVGIVAFVCGMHYGHTLAMSLAHSK